MNQQETMRDKPCASILARMIHDGSSRNQQAASPAASPRGERERRAEA